MIKREIDMFCRRGLRAEFSNLKEIGWSKETEALLRKELEKKFNQILILLLKKLIEQNEPNNQTLQVILRPGCYLTHDVGVYLNAEKRIQASNPVARDMGRSLLPALQLWAYVQAIPESNRAIIALGKRDAAFDAGMPITSLHYRPGISQAPQLAPSDWKITADRKSVV